MLAKYVTKIVPREWYWPSRKVNLPISEPQPDIGKNFDSYLEREEKFGWKINFSVHKNNLEKAKRLAKQLWDLEGNPDSKEEERIIQQLMKIKEKDYDKKTDVEKWGHMAVQLPGDWGPEDKQELKRIITEKASGKVMEAMCGFRSYFNESDIIEVIAMDFCREALERYDYPKRKRILFDLENVVKGEQMEFFEDGEFDTIGVFFAIDYLTDPIPVHKEFYRILDEDGKLLIVGGTSQGYKDILKRSFNPQVCANHMKSAGFSTEIEHLPLKVKTEVGEYFLVEGKK